MMYWIDWLTLWVKWFHVIAGIAWIGASFYFIWLDNSLQAPPEWKRAKGIKGDLWAIHGGGFYEIAKYQSGPQTLPSRLHWFKWEAYSTWISGALLLVLVYYLNASSYLLDTRAATLSEHQAIGFGISFILLGTVLYEGLCRSPLRHSERSLNSLLALVLCAAIYLACTLLNGRAAFIHVGSLIGTIMAANVFLKIIPAQKKLVDAVARKVTVDPLWGADAKQRSVHNNYLTLPLVFMMISNHYPLTYQHPLNWLILILLTLCAGWIRHYFNLRHQGSVNPLILVTGALAMVAIAGIAVVTQHAGTSIRAPGAESAHLLPDVKPEQVAHIIQKHCLSCHSATPDDAMFSAPPMGVVFDSWDEIKRQAAPIRYRVSVTRDMPLLNKSAMSDEERRVIENWYKNLQSKQ